MSHLQTRVDVVVVVAVAVVIVVIIIITIMTLSHVSGVCDQRHMPTKYIPA